MSWNQGTSQRSLTFSPVTYWESQCLKIAWGVLLPFPWKTAGQGAAELPCWRGSDPRAASQQCWGGSWTIPRRCPFHSHALTPLSCFLPHCSPNQGFLLGFEASESRNWSHTSIFLTIINNNNNSQKNILKNPRKQTNVPSLSCFSLQTDSPVKIMLLC